MRTSRSIAARLVIRLRDNGPATVTELSGSLQVSRTTIEKAIGPLEAAGIIIGRNVSTPNGAGRPARHYSFHTASGSVVGIDIGIGSVRILLADLAGRVIAQREFAGVGAHADGAAKVSAVIECVRDTITTAAEPGSVLAAGVSLPGIVDATGRVTASVVIPEWSGVDIGSQLQRALGIPMSVDNGVRLAAIAEHHLGVAQFVDDVIYISAGNRISMGIILDGKPRRGVHSAAGDVGRLAFPGMVNGSGQITWQAAPTAAEVFEKARSSDETARAEVVSFVENLARGIATLTMTVDPSMIVVGGGVSEAHEELLGPLRDAVGRHIGLPFQIPLVAARLGAAAAAHGALVYAFQQQASLIYGLEGIPVPPITPKVVSTATTGKAHRAS